MKQILQVEKMRKKMKQIYKCRNEKYDIWALYDITNKCLNVIFYNLYGTLYTTSKKPNIIV